MCSVEEDFIDSGDEVVDGKIIEAKDDSPIEQVRLTVPTTDDPGQPCLTFRTWVVGVLSCVLLAFVNQFFGYRTNQLSISSVCVQILALPVGRWMARVLPRRRIRLPLTGRSFSLNPGPFSTKEHVLITIFAGSGSGGNYAVNILTIVKAFYHRGINFFAAMLLTQTTQLLGYGWAGIFRSLLVDSPFMWWPSSLIQVSLFRALNEEEKRPKGSVSRLQFFLVVTVCSFAYYLIPNFFFPAISSLSVVCLIWKKSIVAQQIGSGLKGMGVGSIGLDWSAVTGFLGSPIAAPPFVLFNVLAGFVILIYLVIPIAYWSNIYGARRFQFLSSHLYDRTGKPYDIDRVLDEKTFTLDVQEYESYSKIYMSIFFASSYGLGFATLTATVSHVFLFQGSDRSLNIKQVYVEIMASGVVESEDEVFGCPREDDEGELRGGPAVVVLCHFGRRHGALNLRLRRLRRAASASLLGHLPRHGLGFLLHSPHRSHLRHHQHGTGAQHRHRDGDRLHFTRQASGQRVVQDVWIYQHDSGHHLPLRFQARPVHEDSPEGHVHRPAGWDADRERDLLRDGVVAADDGAAHLRRGQAAGGKPVDVPRRRRVLQRVHHLGRGRAAAHVRPRQRLRQPQLLLPHRPPPPGAGLALLPPLPGEEVDPARQLPRHPGGHRDDAAGARRELQLLARRRFRRQPLGLPPEQEVVGEVRLRAIRGHGRRHRLHGRRGLLRPEQQQHLLGELVGRGGRRLLPAGQVPHRGRRLPSHRLPGDPMTIDELKADRSTCA